VTEVSVWCAVDLKSGSLTACVYKTHLCKTRRVTSASILLTEGGASTGEYGVVGDE
jgi:hypothetical protein